MTVAGRGLCAAFTACLLTLAACSGDGGARDCASDDQCAAGARCTSGTCVVNQPPVASVAAPLAVEAFTIVTLDGSASVDPDAGDAVESHAWRVVSLDAPCPAPVVAGTSATAQARFGCAGRYAVELTVYDALGAASPPASRELEVLPSTAAPIATALPDVVVGHRCAGDPLVCAVDTPEQTVAIGATAGATPPRFRWVAVPPEGLALDATRRVTFAPSADVLAPTVRIETDGTAISGDWVFRLEVYDDLGVLGAAAMRVSVTNSPPVLEATPGPVPHRFDAAASRFTAGGEIGVLAYDPDGDPLVRQVSSRVVGQGPATFHLVDLGDRITFSIQVPYTTPADAGHLIGGPGLERAVSLELRDPNGGVVRETWPIVVENQPPALAAPLLYGGGPHGFDPVAARYVSTSAASRWLDPEGDPLVLAEPTGDAVCANVAFRVDGTAEVTCSAAFAGTPALVGFLGTHHVTVLPRDPWAAAAAPSVTRVFVDNRPPVPVPQSYPVTAACGTGACCVGTAAECDEYYVEHGTATFSAAGFVEDPDGDPLLVSNAIDSVVCVPGACALDLRMATGRSCSMSGDASGVATYTATDGALTVSGEVDVGITCVW